jgi:tRNA U38,U39,U40 pseudouridine synthase TruA
MIGAIVQICHGDLDPEQFINNSFTHNGVLVALVPGDGLMLEKVAYDRYNEYNTSKNNEIMLQRVTQT